MSTVTLRSAETLAERAERESLFCLCSGKVSLGEKGLAGRDCLPFALVGFRHGCGFVVVRVVIVMQVDIRGLSARVGIGERVACFVRASFGCKSSSDRLWLLEMFFSVV
jgi:hypothetical protein